MKKNSDLLEGDKLSSDQETIRKLREEINTLKNKFNQDPDTRRYSLDNELANIRREMNKSSPTRMVYRVIDDHKNIYLYTGSNHRVGPLHPNNAIETMLRWAKSGVTLYSRKRTEEEVEEFKRSAVWQEFIEENKRRRDAIKKKDNNEVVDKIVNMLAKVSPAT
jgi:hypothetical protein